MKLKIKRKAAAPAKQLAETDAQAIKRWNNFPAPNAKPKTCAFCEREYIRPCDTESASGSCANWLYRQGLQKAAT